MHIGLIGGIGPASTVVYYQRLCARMRELGQPLDLTIVQADAPTQAANNKADRRDAQAAIYAGLIDRLQAAGADCAAITSLGGHFCFDETKALSALPLISAVAPLDRYFADQGLQTVGLLGTAVVMKTALYGQLQHTRAVVPNDPDALGQTYLDMALSGQCTPAQRSVFFNAGSQMMARNAEAIVLAGTDLGLAFLGHDPGFPVIDALDVHVDLLVDLASGARSIEDVD